MFKMDENLEENPFAALFPTLDDARQFRDEIYKNRDVLFGSSLQEKKSSRKTSPSSSKHRDEEKRNAKSKQDVNLVIENIFLVTINKEPNNNSERPSHCVYLNDLHQMAHGRTHLDMDYLEEAVFERLMLDEPSNYVITTKERVKNGSTAKDASENVNLLYLYGCYCRSITEQVKPPYEKLVKECQNVIFTNTRMVLCHPEIYEGQAAISQQFINLFLEYYSQSAHHDRLKYFLEITFKDIEEAHQNGEEDYSLSDTCYPILDLLFEKYRNFSLVDVDVSNLFPIIHFFSGIPSIAKVFLDHSTPQTVTLGKSFEITLLGSILHLSCVPQSELGPFEFFDRPSQFTQQEHSITERNLWVPLHNLNMETYELFNRLLRVSSDIRHQVLNWLGCCCHSNSGRAKLWTHVQSLLSTNVSDAFMLNLGNVMLYLCKPFAEAKSPKLLRIDPTYCGAVVSTDDDIKMKGIYLRDIHRETCLITLPEGVNRPTIPNYNFPTICFFITHRVLNLGFNAVLEKFVRLNQELARVQRLYEDARAQAGETSETVQNIKNTMERGMSQFLSIKAALLEPNTLELMLSFHIASATWLSHIATCSELGRYETIQFPLSTDVPLYLACIPEFIVDSIAEYVIFLRRFSGKTLDLAGSELEHLMTLILVFMGSPERIKNPHLRAKLAEMLEALMPHEDSRSFSFISLLGFQREKLFVEHPYLSELVPTLLNVFVSIEMTGQSVAFEQKFNYRRPMYVVMDYIWHIETHREIFKKLAKEAEENMESTTPPLFLRFINLLINDAIFLLDEALSYMARIKEQQHLRDSGGLQNLPPDQRQQNEANFQHMGMLARFHNVMGNSTIHILELLTREIVSIFTHPAIVDRIAAMLNYFLLHLVGPKKKQLKVKDLAEYEFKPHDLVRDICLIYLHLGSNMDFCQAVSKDGRSYSPDLFVQAELVLNRIGQGAMITDLKELAAKILGHAERYQAEDEVLNAAPDEFLDPIMGTLMSDPVVLPSSQVTVDRATIARHLLSDQTDPFNRSTLSMDMVIPNDALKKRIEEWLGSIRKPIKSSQFKKSTKKSKS